MKKYTARQNFIVQGVLAIVVVGALLPVAMAVELFSLAGTSPARAVQHGELFLAAGGAVFLGCILLVTARPDRSAAVNIATLFAVATFVLPCYGAWAFLNVRPAVHDHVAKASSYGWGIPILVLGLGVALSFVWYSFPATRVEDE